MLKKALLGITLLVFVLGQSVCFANPIPNLVGTWTVSSEGVVLLKANDTTKYGKIGTPLDKEGKIKAISSSSADMKIIITEQKGRIFHGIKQSGKITEKLAGVIGYDNKTIHCVDDDGFNEGTYDSENDRIETYYKHAGDTDSMVVVDTWTRVE